MPEEFDFPPSENSETDSWRNQVKVRVEETQDDVADLETRVTSLEGQTDEKGLVLIEAQTADGLSEVTFTTGIDDTYEEYLISVLNFIPEPDGPRLRLETSSDGGATWDNGGSDYGFAVEDLTDSGVAGDSTSSGSDHVNLTPDTSEGTGTPAMGVSLSIHVVNPADTGRHTVFHWHGAYLDNNNDFAMIQGAGRRIEAGAVDAIRIRFNTGNIVSGEAKLYGIVKS